MDYTDEKKILFCCSNFIIFFSVSLINVDEYV